METVRILILISLVKTNKGSITGVTYMDHFDFEDRYRNVNECNPFYWHPLHLPEECIEMYEKLIRSNIASLGSVQVFKTEGSHEFLYDVHPSTFTTMPQRTDVRDMYYKRQRLSPIQRMIEMVRRDSRRVPVAPEIRMAPNGSPVALYHQPISSASETLIKEIADAYRQTMYQKNKYTT